MNSGLAQNQIFVPRKMRWIGVLFVRLMVCLIGEICVLLIVVLPHIVEIVHCQLSDKPSSAAFSRFVVGVGAVFVAGFLPIFYVASFLVRSVVRLSYFVATAAILSAVAACCVALYVGFQRSNYTETCHIVVPLIFVLVFLALCCADMIITDKSDVIVSRD